MAGRSERRLKIAFVFMPANTVRPPVWSTSYGTAGDLVMDELARRVARSHNVIAYCLRGAGQEPVEHCEGVEYRRVTAPLDRRFQSYQRKMMRLAGFVRQQNTPWTVLNSEWWHRQYIGKVVGDPALRDCDIIHIMNISQFVRIARSRVPRTRVVLHMHCQWLEQLDAKAIERRIKAADLILGVSDFIAAGVRRRFPELAQRCSHIYNGADPDLFRRLGGVQAIPKQILYVGRLAPEKGIHVLLDAFRTVLAQHPDAHLKLIGPHTVFPRAALFPNTNDRHLARIDEYFEPGVYAQVLRRKVAEFPLGSITVFDQGIKFIDLPAHYHSASIFAFPSVCEESFGMPLVEAMASGTPVIATCGGAFPEIVEDGRTGLLVERSDPQALATAILKLLGNTEQRAMMAQAAQKRAATTFSWDHIAGELIEAYERLLH